MPDTRLQPDHLRRDLDLPRPNSRKTLWQEIAEVQKARNAVIHKGEKPTKSAAPLAVAVAATLLTKIFPQILEKLSLHLHEPITVCSEQHPTSNP